MILRYIIINIQNTHTQLLIYCIECGEEADVCFCGSEKIPSNEFVDMMPEHLLELKCYCKKHQPKQQ